MKLILAVAAGGALGSLCRFGMARVLAFSPLQTIPLGTLSVNVIGSFFAGLLFVSLAPPSDPPEMRAFLLTGFLGGFTTFSAFSLDTLRLIEDERMVAALMNVGLNLVLSLVACAFGMWVARRFG